MRSSLVLARTSNRGTSSKFHSLHRQFSARYLSNMPSRRNNEQITKEDDDKYLTEQLAVDLISGQATRGHPIRACIAIAGGGANAASAIASTPGASSVLLEAIVAYDRRSFAEFVSTNLNMEGARDDANGWMSELESMEDTSSGSDTSSHSSGSFHFCSAQAAILLSRSALNRSLKLSPSFRDRCLHCVGVGSASSLVGLASIDGGVNDRRRNRKSRAYVAISTLRDGTIVWEVELSNGLGASDQTQNNEQVDQVGTQQVLLQNRRTRSQEETVVSNLILMAMLKCRDLTSKQSKTDYQPILDQILRREGDSIHEKWLEPNRRVPRTPTQSPAEGARRIISGESNIVVVLPVDDHDSPLPVEQRNLSQLKMISLYDDDQIPLAPDALIIPGSFNPPHIGHVQLANAAISTLQRMRQVEAHDDSLRHSLHSMPSSVSSTSSVLSNIWSTVQSHSDEQYEPTVLFEISVTNVDKPPIDPNEVCRRLNLFLRLHSDLPKDWGVLLTNAPLFSQKATLLDHSIGGSYNSRKMTFVIGTDTMVRLIDAKYYGNNEENMMSALEEMKDKGVHFVVGGRLEQGTQDG